MSIIYDRAEINRAMQSLQPPKAARSNGRYLCRECYCYLGQLSVGAILDCQSCGVRNRVEG